MLKNKNKNINEVGEKRTRTSTRVNASGANLINFESRSLMKLLSFG
jgi:hypothetical protein